MILALHPECPYCSQPLVLSVEMLEVMVKMDTQYDDPFDQAIAEALKQRNGKNRMLPMADIPFIIWLDTDLNAIFLAAWCSKCRRLSAPVYPLSKLQDIMEKGKSAFEE